MASPTTGALSGGDSAVLTADSTSGTWTTFTAAYVCSDPADPEANAWLAGSVDGVSFFPLRPYDSFPPSEGGAGVRFYKNQPVTAVQAFVRCSAGNTVTVTVTGE